MERPFSGPHVVLGAAAFQFCSLGFLSCYQAGMAILPQTYGIDLSLVGLAATPSSLVAFLVSFVYAWLDRRLHARGLMLLSAVLAAVATLLLYVGSGLPLLALAFSVMGIMSGTGTFAVVTEVVSAWYVERRADMVSLALGAGMIGSSAYQFVGGQLFSRLGLREGILALGIFTSLAILAIARFVVVGNVPEELGQVALGAEKAPSAQEAASDVPVPELHSGGSLMRNPVLWLTSLARLMGAGSVLFVSMYATATFGEAGIELGHAATIVSVMTLLAALFSFCNGRIVEAVGPKSFLAIVLVCTALDNLAMAVYGARPGMLVLVVVVALYVVGCSSGLVNNLVIDRLFLPGDQTDANARLVGMLNAGYCVWMPVSGLIIGQLGFTGLYAVVALMNVVALACWFAALGLARRQGVAG